MPIEVVLTGVALLLIGGWIVAQFVAGDPIENWKRSQDRTDDEDPNEAD